MISFSFSLTLFHLTLVGCCCCCCYQGRCRCRGRSSCTPWDVLGCSKGKSSHNSPPLITTLWNARCCRPPLSVMNGLLLFLPLWWLGYEYLFPAVIIFSRYNYSKQHSTGVDAIGSTGQGTGYVCISQGQACVHSFPLL